LKHSNLDLLISPKSANLYTARADRFKRTENIDNRAAPNARLQTVELLRDEEHTVLENSDSTPKRHVELPSSIHQTFATESKYDKPLGAEAVLLTNPLRSLVVIKSATK
jgi:hypothetical protein